MRQRQQTARLISRIAVLLAASSLLVLTAAQPAAADANPDDPETPTIDSDDWEPSPAATIAHKPTGPTQSGKPVSLVGCWQSNALGNLVPCGGGGSTYTPPARPTTPPSTPSAPSLSTPAISLSCTTTGWDAEWTPWASTSTVEYEAQWEAEWRSSSDPAGVWHSIVPTVSGAQMTLSGAPQPSQTVEVQVRGEARRRAGNSIGWSDWSVWSTPTVWGTASTNCPTPPLPIPVVTACRSAAGIEVSWTLPSGTWATGTGWLIDVNELPNYVFLSSSIGRADAIPWAERSTTIAGVPVGNEILVTVWAYDAGPPDIKNTWSAIAEDGTAAQPESGCGGGPATTAAPGPLADPSPTLTCGPTSFLGGFTSWADGAPANWDREADYDAAYEDTNGVWKSTAVVVHGSGELRFSGPADPGNDVDIRVRGRGRHRQQVAGTWTPWSTWGAWSGWHTHTTPTCVTVPSPPTAPSPTNLAAACATVSSTLTAQATWAAPGNTATLQYRHTVSWVVTPTSGTSVTHTTGPHTTLSATITNLSHSLAAGDMVSIYVSTQARARTHISGSTYTPWSAWGTASAQAGPVQTSPGCPVPPPPPIPCSSNPALIAAVYPPGYAEPYTDTNGNGSWDSGEPFLDHNNDGIWTADIGGVLTGQCFPPGSICLQPGEVCLAMGS